MIKVKWIVNGIYWHSLSRLTISSNEIVIADIKYMFYEQIVICYYCFVASLGDNIF